MNSFPNAYDGEASTHPGCDRTPVFTGSSNTKLSEATLENISQNMYGAIGVGFNSASAGRTRLYCNVPI